MCGLNVCVCVTLTGAPLTQFCWLCLRKYTGMRAMRECAGEL